MILERKHVGWKKAGKRKKPGFKYIETHAANKIFWNI